MASQKRKKRSKEEVLLEQFETQKHEVAQDCEDVIISQIFPPRPPYDKYGRLQMNIKLLLKTKQTIQSESSTTLVTTTLIAAPVEDYSLMVFPNQEGFFKAAKEFVSHRFIGRICIPVQNVTTTTVTLEAGTEIGELHFIPFGIK